MRVKIKNFDSQMGENIRENASSDRSFKIFYLPQTEKHCKYEEDVLSRGGRHL